MLRRISTIPSALDSDSRASDKLITAVLDGGVLPASASGVCMSETCSDVFA
jgi:hypothetical protein